jgi:predicted amidohydrolase YtcJ
MGTSWTRVEALRRVAADPSATAAERALAAALAARDAARLGVRVAWAPVEGVQRAWAPRAEPVPVRWGKGE